MKSMKDKLIYLNRIASVIIAVITTLVLIPTLTAAAPSKDACVTPVIEQYGIGHSSFGDTPLRWRVFVPTDGETHPAIIVIHGGGFKGGDFDDTRTDQDLVCAGFCVFDIEYRLAPGAACDSERWLFDLAPPYRRFSNSSSPVFISATNLDPMPPNQFAILVNKVAAVGVRNCEQLLITERPGPDGCTRHSFGYWPHVKGQAIAFLNTWLNNPTPIAPVAE